MNEFLRRMLFLPRQGSSMARELDYLHYSVILITMGGAVAVALTAAYFIVRYRKGRKHEAWASAGAPEPPGLVRRIEVLLGGSILLLFVVWWVIGYHQFVRLELPPPDAITIYATGKQWMWTFAYPNGRGSKGVLYVPARRPVKLVMSSRDVIHSFYVPEFRLKKDVIPGRTTTLWFEAVEPGQFAAYCAEYCGEGHSTMRASVVALSDADYAAMLEELPSVELDGPLYREPELAGVAPRRPLALAEVGENVAVTHGCMRCHTADGTPHIGPTWVGMYGASVNLLDGGRVTADVSYLTESMMDPLAKIHAGFEPVMPSYQGRLDAAEVGALLEYIRSLSVQPVARQSPLAPANSPPIRLPVTREAQP
jgi:cytochrome c oxidase subunit II